MNCQIEANFNGRGNLTPDDSRTVRLRTNRELDKELEQHEGQEWHFKLESGSNPCLCSASSGERFGLLIHAYSKVLFRIIISSHEKSRRRGGEEVTSSSIPFGFHLEFLQSDIPATYLTLCKATVHLKFTLQQHGVLRQAEQRLPML
jgi:hypothetical protein